MHGVPRPSRALWIPFVSVIVLLTGLAIVPLVTATHVRVLRRHLDEHVAPARVAVNDLEAAIGVELYAGAAGARASTTGEPARGLTARAADVADLHLLDSLVTPLGDASTRAALVELQTGLAAWHNGRSDMRSDERGLTALDAAARLDSALARYGTRQSARISGAERLELATDAILILLALAGVVMLARVGVHTARLAALAESQRRDLVAAHAERESVLRGVTHDLRNPLAAARGHLELVADGMLGPVTPRQADSLARSRRLITATLDGVGDLLTVALADAGHLTIHTRRVALDTLARDAVAEHAVLAAQAGLELTCSIASAGDASGDGVSGDGVSGDGVSGDGSSLWVETDPARVHQVLGNLLSNACKYTPRGGRVELAGGAGPGKHCWLAVRDSGPGVPRDAYERIFGEAVRLDGTRHIAGAGVGLAAARRVARALGGDLTVGVAPQGGAAFVLTLPTRGA